MNSNHMIPYKENIFSKIFGFIKRIFKKEEKVCEEKNQPIEMQPSCSNTLSLIEEKERLRKLQLQYDNGEIDEEQISSEDVEKLIELYNKETEELKKDTEMRKKRISQMLINLKTK